MTGFDDSYHLWTDDVRDVRALLRRAGRYAMVLGDRGPFIPFVAEPEAGPDAIVAANRGVLVRYDFAEGHGVSLQVFEGVEAGGSLDFGPRTAPRDAARFASTLARLGVVDDAGHAALLALAARVPAAGLSSDGGDLTTLTDELLQLLGMRRLRVSNGHLLAFGRKELVRRFPEAEIVGATRKGKGAQATPNEWCSEPGKPRFMYLPLPDASHLDASQRATAAKHLAYWLTTRDWDDDAQEGFWLYEAYKRLLPARYSYLPDRLMNQDDPEACRRTIESIISVTPRDFDWEPVLAQPSPAPVRL